MTHLRLVIALLAVVLAPHAADAFVGDYKTVTGVITLWGPNRFDQQIAVVRDDQAQDWVVRFGPGTLPRGAAVGTEVTLLGRETAVTSELDALSAAITSSPSALPTNAASGWAVVPGSVQDSAGTTARIRGNGGTMITVDTSQLDPDARTWLVPGRGVTVVGTYRADGVLAASGVARAEP